MLRACVGCGAPTTSARCSACATPRLPGWAWQRLSAQILNRDGRVCRICGGTAVTTTSGRSATAAATIPPTCAACAADATPIGTETPGKMQGFR
jgi:hypothetical protein